MKSSGLVFIKIIIAIFAIFAVIVVGYQLYKYNVVSIKTESAVMGEIEESVKSTGVFFRNESVIEKNGSEYLDVIRSEGERIAAGGTLARVYADERSAIEQTEIRNIEQRIATYEEVLSNSGSYTSAVKGIENEIYNCLGNISQSAHDEDARSAFETADNLMIEIMKKKIASGDVVHYDAVLQELRTQLKEMQASAGESVREIKTDNSGHFSLVSDGLETQMTPDVLESMDTLKLDEIIEKCRDVLPSNDHIGKLVLGNSWSIALKVPTTACNGLDVKDTVFIRIPTYGTDRIKCTIADIRKSGDDTLLILQSSVISGNILTLRCEEISLILRTHSGIMVRQSALRKVEGEDGIYVKVGLLLRYKKVKIIYNDGENVILQYNAADTGGVRIYDEVVYKGSDLYDGKAVSDG